MTFGNAGWGSSDDVSEAISNAYVEACGNFVDTADVYSSGRSEELLGRFIATRKLRDDHMRHLQGIMPHLRRSLRRESLMLTGVTPA